ncbi:hypothetical protein A3742_01100 [Oleiphilus sp. HI0071]|nr:hypothetical protein A3737_03995 [Oleiphilus sp. HI0065]KZY83049.1 hypothetical protein A3742_01100 [Oleiphilus sp. HI0071]KZY98795.1 hypothetical protein A3744_12825 [Oleiphilus sp. HI0073]KZZ10025.1 hypothetical protein A3750_08210 [Oleiphilus sp. HI0079]KZZ17605.1 hypothetical protein A3751_11100 [Oleiphilus sp. HI0080]KZZ49593.1 hypothetical protein A3760_02675 [Oleiphilus sp. HI0122]KZZ73632.1 hypothetical protein A3765_12320 [Oleiphilus sp. HI0130]KZZ77749.1 hypothetical protein A37
MSAFILKPLFQHLFVLCVTIFLVACETELPDNDVRILNESALPTEMTWYAPVDIPIEITGGQGGYAVRYIQNPESGMSEELIGEFEDVNRVELAVVHDSGNTFRLQGVPVPSALLDRNLDSAYWIEVTDGVSSIVVRVEFSISDVAIDELETFVSFAEGEANLRASSGPGVRGKTVCEEATEVEPDPISVAQGTAYPVQVVLKLSTAVSVPVVFDVSVLEASNVERVARSGVDFLPLQGQLSFAEGVTACSVTFYVIDDSEIEAIESLSVSFDGERNIVGDLGVSIVNVTINDDEPRVEPFDLEYIQSPGDTLAISFEIGAPAEKEIFVPVNVSLSETNLEDADYSLNPASRIVSIAEGESSGVFSISLGSPMVTAEPDPKLVIEVQGDSSSDPRGVVSITVNSFNNTDPLDLDSGEHAVAATEGADSLYIATDYQNGANNAVRIRRLSSFGEAMLLNGAEFFELGVAGADFAVKGVEVISMSNGIDELALVIGTNINYAGSLWGGTDFVLVRFSIADDGTITELSRSQHGSESDDLVESVRFFDDQGLVITGSSSGSALDGEAVIAPSGQADGFVYLFDTGLGLDYRRFIGDDSDNVALGSGFTDTGVQVLTSDAQGIEVSSFDEDGFVDSDLPILEVRQFANYDFGGSDNYARDRLAFLVSSEYGSDLSVTPSLSKDIFFYDLTFNDSGSANSLFSIASSEDDVAIGLAKIEDKEVLGIAGDTLGEFQEGASISGVGGRDVFFASVGIQGTPSLGIVTQFGTPGEDYAIDIEAVNDEKFLVLWKENHTSGDGTFRYRIAPFAPDGTNLAPLPF